MAFEGLIVFKIQSSNSVGGSGSNNSAQGSVFLLSWHVALYVYSS